jgi:hypothetical protein
MLNFVRKTIKSRNVVSIVASSALSILLLAGVAQAVTTISTNISTGGTLSVTGTSALTGATTVTGALYADGGLDRSSGAALTIGGTNATSLDIGTTGVMTTVKGTLNVDEAVTLDSTLVVGATGSAVSLIKTGSATMSFTGFVTGQTGCVAGSSNITVTGATAGSPVFIGLVTASASTTAAAKEMSFTGWVDATNIVVVKACNHSTSTTPTIAAAVVKAYVLQ